jgi:hypothetical protein
MAAWQEIEAAQQIQSDHAYFWHALRPNWAGVALKCPLTLADLQAAQPRSIEPSKPFGARDYAPFRDPVASAGAIAPALREAAEHFARASAHLQTAVALVAPSSKLDHWYTPEPGAPARLTPRELLDQEIIAIRSLEQTQRRMSRFFAAYALVQTLPPPGTPERETALKALARHQAEEAEAIDSEEVAGPK